MVTAFKNIFDRSPHYTTVDKALERIQGGASREMISQIRGQLNKERADKLKQNLPCILFSGKFSTREDSSLTKHSGFLVLDFDDVADVREKQTEIISHDFVYACWISPRGNGLKALVKVADGSKHRLHFAALQEIMPEIDKSGVNEARVCYESFDPDIYINRQAKPFTKTKKVELIQTSETQHTGVFTKLVTWLTNKGDAFVTGERNSYIFKLASACCRFGMSQDEALSEILRTYSSDNTFTENETKRAVASAYKSNRQKQGTAAFEKEILVEKVTRSEVQLEKWVDDDGKVKDVIYGEFVKDKAINILRNGYEKVQGIGVPEFDELFKMKRGEITCLTGVGNYGKSSFVKFMLLMRAVLFDEKFALFAPEDNPPEEFYHDMVEMLLGNDCTPKNPYKPSEDTYQAAYDWVAKRFFYLYPKGVRPTPEYIKEKFLEMIITENCAGNVIDPFNQLSNDYGARSDKYLETFLSDYARFNQENNQYGIIVAHPHKLSKGQDGNYPCPDVFELADGAMWNNKMDNILVYHRPYMQTDPNNALCEFHSKKIRRQKTVGKKGFVLFELHRPKRRYYFNNQDPLEKALMAKGIEFEVRQSKLWSAWRPVDDINDRRDLR